ncbi:MAG: hypothetical protein HY886_01500 [Deltaproteobacteria bacterium]|nr:hypothetical protein [Deltaproteobacteria bacterium]
MDFKLAQVDSAFAVIIAPWLPVKCYYALYYLESVLSHLINGSVHGFGRGGHTGVRKQIYSLSNSGSFSFSVDALNRVYTLTEIRELPAIDPGQNARADYWREPECVNSIVKKLTDYKLLEKKLGWNLHTKKHREEQNQFIAKERLMILDFFYWYRIKANYRDLDYIDFENGIAKRDVLKYTETYFKAFKHYSAQLVNQIEKLRCQ